jgi:Spy/CpxP family protein refolding chaperone
MRTTLIAAALALVAAIAVAQPAAPTAQGKMPMGMPGMMMDMPKMPDLAADQWVKMDAARTDHLRTVGPIQTDLAVKKLELTALWRAENIDAKKIMAKANEISSLKAKLDAAKVDHMIAMYNILTPDQRKSMRMGMHGMMQRRMMPGMMMQGCPMMGGGMMESGMMSGMGSTMMGDAAMDPDAMMTESE